MATTRVRRLVARDLAIRNDDAATSCKYGTTFASSVVDNRTTNDIDASAGTVDGATVTGIVCVLERGMFVYVQRPSIGDKGTHGLDGCAVQNDATGFLSASETERSVVREQGALVKGT